ncbi:MAG TPA: hypothetical protein GX404_03755 [Syntrophomonadaceae bacterium]|nr:hypothetical protein [Syntrophomonadaceae bacterium]
MDSLQQAQENAEITQSICSLIGHFEALQLSEEMETLLQTEVGNEIVALHTAIQDLKEYLADLPSTLFKEDNP